MTITVEYGWEKCRACSRALHTDSDAVPCGCGRLYCDQCYVDHECAHKDIEDEDDDPFVADMIRDRSGWTPQCEPEEHTPIGHPNDCDCDECTALKEMEF